MRPRTHIPLHALAALLVLAGLALLWQLRPGLPALPESWTAPMSSADAEEILFWVLWLVLAALLLLIARRLVNEIALTIKQRRERERAAFAERMLSKPMSPPPTASRYPIYADRYTMVLPPRANHDDEYAPERPALADRATPDATRTATPEESKPALALSISVLGPLRIDGLKRPLKRAPTREIIAYLALRPPGATRDELIEALWPDQDPQHSLPRLYQSVTDARKALGDAWIREGERYQLDRTKIHIDLDELNRLLATNDSADEQHALETALSLWRGAPLAGSDYPWAEGPIHRLHATLLDLLGRVGAARLTNGDPQGALQAAEQAITLDNLHEPSWRLALQAEHALGFRSSVTKRYDALAHLLDEQLGLQPSHETKMTYRQLLGQS